MIRKILLFLSTVKCILNKIEMPDELIEMNIMQMAKFNGYPIMEYDIVTEDGYRLTLHRIPGGKGEKVIDAI